MLLSEAIILGDTLKKCDPGEWISDDGSCGCALGGALLATGLTSAEFGVQANNIQPWGMEKFIELPCIKARWPWLTTAHVYEISNLYYDAQDGSKNIEDVAAYVRSVEPAEQSTANILDAREEVTVA